MSKLITVAIPYMEPWQLERIGPPVHYTNEVAAATGKFGLPDNFDGFSRVVRLLTIWL
jgi:hypothetical protein